jgi:hypothetical protein
MGSLTKLQVYMLKTLINEPLEAFKLRKKYTRSFDYMFKYAFGKSFGVEIEINPNFYKSITKGSTFFNIDPKNHGFTKQMTLIEKTAKSEYEPRRYKDGVCHEYTFPVRAQNLHIVYKYLKQIRRLLIGELGVGDFDTSSSMHIHLTPSIVNSNYIDTGIYHYFNSFESQLSRHSGPGQQTCIEANRMLVLKSINLSSRVKNCHMCHGCLFNILDYINKPVEFKKYLNHKFRRRSVDFQNLRYITSSTSAIKVLIHPMYRLLYLMKDGSRKAEKVYLYALELMDLKYRDKLAFILGQYNEIKLEIMLDHSIAYFIPYMSEIDINSMKRYLPSLNDTMSYNGYYNSIEIRLFAGSTNFSTIMKRTLMYNSLKTLIATSDPTLLNLFLTII